jgi:hypothetical protein
MECGAFDAVNRRSPATLLSLFSLEPAVVQALKSVNFSYVVEEDRILAAINPGEPEAWSCWLTRRLVLTLLERAAEFLASTSHLMKQAPANARDELATFEREAAMAKTAGAMSITPTDVIKASASTAELATRLKIANQADGFRVELRGERGGGAAGLFVRAELQRLLQMLQAEVTRAGWLTSPAKPPIAATEQTGPKPVRH